MTKSKVVLVLGLMLGMVGSVHAASGVRGAKAAVAIVTTVPTGVSSGAAVLYSVTLGTGAVTDYVALFDSASVTGLASGAQLSGNFRIRIYASSATQNTLVTFDPPLQFNNGIMAINATAVMSSVIAFEKGRVSQGY